MTFDATRECALRLDAEDSLRGFRNQFNFPDDFDGRRNIYVCGNSLGLQPKSAVGKVTEVLSDWAHLGVHAHFDADSPWIEYQRQTSSGFATLCGASESEVVAMNTLTVNLHILMASFFKPQGQRKKILVESTAFPSDYYAATSQLEMHGLDPSADLLEWTPRENDILHMEDLEAIVDESGDQIALMLLPGVQYLNGQVLDMQRICELGHHCGAVVGLDLAHAIGNIPMSLHDWGADFAAWCTYKYLNAGPGSIAGAFVHQKHLEGAGRQHLTGWWGNARNTRFDMARTFDPEAGAERWQMSNPPILSLAPVIASLDMFQAAGMAALREKSQQQTAYLAFLLSEFAGRIESLTPPDARGCQFSLVVRDDNVDGRDLFDALTALHVTGDWREPNVIRVSPVPLYNSFEDIFELVTRLRDALDRLT